MAALELRKCPLVEMNGVYERSGTKKIYRYGGFLLQQQKEDSKWVIVNASSEILAKSTQSGKDPISLKWLYFSTAENGLKSSKYMKFVKPGTPQDAETKGNDVRADEKQTALQSATRGPSSDTPPSVKSPQEAVKVVEISGTTAPSVRSPQESEKVVEISGTKGPIAEEATIAHAAQNGGVDERDPIALKCDQTTEETSTETQAVEVLKTSTDKKKKDNKNNGEAVMSEQNQQSVVTAEDEQQVLLAQAAASLSPELLASVSAAVSPKKPGTVNYDGNFSTHQEEGVDSAASGAATLEAQPAPNTSAASNTDTAAGTEQSDDSNGSAATAATDAGPTDSAAATTATDAGPTDSAAATTATDAGPTDSAAQANSAADEAKLDGEYEMLDANAGTEPAADGAVGANMGVNEAADLGAAVNECAVNSDVAADQTEVDTAPAGPTDENPNQREDQEHQPGGVPDGPVPDAVLLDAIESAFGSEGGTPHTADAGGPTGAVLMNLDGELAQTCTGDGFDDDNNGAPAPLPPSRFARDPAPYAAAHPDPTVQPPKPSHRADNEPHHQPSPHKGKGAANAPNSPDQFAYYTPGPTQAPAPSPVKQQPTTPYPIPTPPTQARRPSTADHRPSVKPVMVELPRYTRRIPQLVSSSKPADWKKTSMWGGEWENMRTGERRDSCPPTSPNVASYPVRVGTLDLPVFAPSKIVEELDKVGEVTGAAYVDYWENIEPLWSSTVATYEYKIFMLETLQKNVRDIVAQDFAAREEQLTMAMLRQQNELEAYVAQTQAAMANMQGENNTLRKELTASKEREAASSKRADVLMTRVGKNHIKRDWQQSGVQHDFPAGEDIRNEFQSAFLNFESFACDAINCLEDAGDANATGTFVGNVMSSIFSETQSYVQGKLKARRAVLKEQFGVDLKVSDAANDDSVPRLFWYQTQQARMPGEIKSLTDEDIMQLIGSMDEKVLYLHQLMLKAAETGAIDGGEQNLRIPQLVRVMLRLLTIAALSDPRCYLHPAPGQTEYFREASHTEILSPGIKKYGRIKEGDRVEVVLCGLYFDSPATNFKAITPALVRRLV